MQIKISTKITEKFLETVKNKHLNKADLKYKEQPDDYVMKTSFVVTEQYFENDFVKLPDSCRKQKDDTEESHKARVKKYLELCDNSTFTQIAYVIDPSDQFQIEFFNLYNEVQE